MEQLNEKNWCFIHKLTNDYGGSADVAIGMELRLPMDNGGAEQLKKLANG